jgi:D-glycero-alpha-D-manno-heptose-7-phosphate kinase
VIVTKTPFRVSFFGGGTDYPAYFERHGGAVLGTAIDKSLFLSATHFFSKLFDYSIRISYRQVECVKSLDEIEHRAFREIFRRCGVTGDIEVNCAAELPAYTGIGSSSTFVVGLLNTVMAHQGKFMTPMDLAYEAIRIEQDVLSEHVGCQDQTFAAVGGLNVIEFRRRDDIVVHRIPLTSDRIDELQSWLMLVYTGIRRRASDQAAKQIARIDLNLPRLHRMRALVDRGYEALIAANGLASFGSLLHESWLEKAALDPDVSNPIINEIYEAGREAGALGGKLLGAGAGGFVLFLVPPEARSAVRRRLAHLEEVPVRINAIGSHVVYA